MKYIFVAGAPGSKWSSVVKNIYSHPAVDQSDYRDEWTYYHDASGKLELMHLGAYFDPGMECSVPEFLNDLTKEQAEQIFDQPFSGNGSGVRIIKSHVFCYDGNIQYLRKHWPDCPIVLVYRNDDSCLGWWVKCGHFNITYPSYAIYYRDLKTMAGIIKRQNADLLKWWPTKGQSVTNNVELAAALNINNPPMELRQDYVTSDIKVKVI